MQNTITAQQIMHLGSIVARTGLVLVLVIIGLQKFTSGEAHGIQPLVSHSPLFFWMTGVLGVQGTSNFFGLYEVATGLLIAARLVSARLGALGSAMAIVIFVSTVSFLFSTPGALSASSGVGQFILKDITLLGASIWSLGEAVGALERVPVRSSV